MRILFVKLSIPINTVYAYLVGAVVNVHDLIVATPALTGTLLEDSNRVLVTAWPKIQKESVTLKNE
jgi:hypothetical protein